MASVSVYVNVDLDEIENRYLVMEMCRRLKRNNIPDTSKKELHAALLQVPDVGLPVQIEVKTLEDVLKYEHFSKVFTKYPIHVFENLLPE